ncbi:MAG: type I glutamate--ammonia ligase [bacterium]|nr:type I glutamate--ammonia ligase [bacterium]
MGSYTKNDILRLAQEEDVEFIRLQFTDIFGGLKNVAITCSQLENALNHACMFDGSVVEGFVRIEESDMYLYPDLDSFEIFPWRPQQGRVARLICDVYRPNGEPFEGDPRRILRKVQREAKTMGYTLTVAPECEFFLFAADEEGVPSLKTKDKAGFFDVSPLDLSENVRRDIILNLEEMGIGILASHHEKAPSQHEIDLKAEEALRAADSIMTFKMATRTIAKRHGYHATFMPKPIMGVNGSGMHLNLALKNQAGEDVFGDPSDERGLSETAYHFMGGLMAHMRGMALVTNPLVNSYKRLVPNYDAPMYLAWSAKANRSALLRIPSVLGGNLHIELRSPDSAMNPYLGLALCLAAGMDGIKNKLPLPLPVEKNLYHMRGDEREKLGVGLLPETLGEAIVAFEEDGLMRQVLGEHVYDKYLEAKKREWREFRANVTDWEVQEYLYKY